jgi:hypothetical protein
MVKSGGKNSLKTITKAEYQNRQFDMCDYRKGHLKEFLELHYSYLQQINRQTNA